MTVTIIAGNSDDKLSQGEWSQFVDDLDTVIRGDAIFGVHFFGCPPSSARYQNACWVIGLPGRYSKQLRAAIEHVRARYRQNSVALITGKVEFI